MKKWMRIALIVIGVIGISLFFAYRAMIANTKKNSPERIAAYDQGNTHIEVVYSAPFKKGRDIFGGLVPLDTVWRTGANEPTTFDSNVDLNIGGQVLPAGHYTFWTIPGREHWTLIWNSKDYGWGIEFSGKAMRKPEFDVLKIEAQVERLPEVVEQFTIAVEGDNPVLSLSWDQTQVSVPLR